MGCGSEASAPVSRDCFPSRRAQTQFDQSDVIMDTCFFCHQAIENEDDYVLIGLVQDEVAELVPAHQDCADSRSDHVELFGQLESRPLGMA
jgi:hypothetical protein